MLEERKSKDNDTSDNAEDCKKEAKEIGDENKEQHEKRKEVDHKGRKQKHMEEKEIVTNDASKQKEASNTEEVKQLVDKSNAEEETAENAEKETTENAEEESTENAEEETTDDYDEEEKKDYDEERMNGLFTDFRLCQADTTSLFKHQQYSAKKLTSHRP
ncbi:hypothetical protein Pcinc_009085 [Petrolisthes cinctipes]|uniref:Uncharacterized protein n=1 Tax=Petrolisthes cinctipes TaxID=88211 RepID=A0AAE1KYU5_PETCI|nr:hypothetical protein Pcinc_009085 [Petrolisthes cinctipes]